MSPSLEQANFDVRVAVKDSTTLSIAKSIAARFGEEIQEDEFYDEPEQTEQQASKATV